MTQPALAAWPAESARLLEPSISYALGAVVAITPELLSRRTPCRDWDLRTLLRHASESLAAIAEGIETGRVDLDPAAEDGDLAADPARAFRDRAGAARRPDQPRPPGPGHRHRRLPPGGQHHGRRGSPRGRRPRVGHIPGVRAAPADPARPGHRPAGDSPAARPPRRPAPPVRCTSHRASNGQPQRPARRLPRTRSPAIASPSGRITLHTRVIIASFFGLICGDDHPCINRSARDLNPHARNLRICAAIRSWRRITAGQRHAFVSEDRLRQKADGCPRARHRGVRG